MTKVLILGAYGEIAPVATQSVPEKYRCTGDPTVSAGLEVRKSLGIHKAV